MELVLVDKSNYKEAIKIQNCIFPKENGVLNILASLDRKLFIIRIYSRYSYIFSELLGWFGILKVYRNKGLGRKLLRM